MTCLRPPGISQMTMPGGMILIPGTEITANGPHLLHVNASCLIAPTGQRQGVLNMAADKDPRSFVIANHPNWEKHFNHTSMEQLKEWVGYTGLEIFNGTVGRLEGSPYATNKWDMLLDKGRRVWEYANDDCHLPVNDVGLGWNVVYAASKTLPDIVAALRNGRFYASTGVSISNIDVDGSKVRIETENAERIVAIREVGKRFAQVDSNAIEIEIPPKAKYVRFECWGAGESFAWTQPLFIRC